MLKKICCFLICLSACKSNDFNTINASKTSKNAWATVSKVESSIRQIKPSGAVVKMIEHQADTTGQKDNLPIIVKLIDRCKDGCIVHFTKGKYLFRGPIHLRDNVHLKLDEGAEIVFEDDPSLYLPKVKTRWEGTVLYNYSPLIYAYQKKNISITGRGTINGNGQKWSSEWRKLQKPAQTKLRQMGNDLVPEALRQFGADSNYYLRPPLVQFYECDGVLLEGCTFLNSPFWTIHLPFTNNVVARGLTIRGGILNDDGLDPDSSIGVLIENCDISTHDDAISIKAGRDQDAWNRGGSKNIIIRNNKLKSLTNAFCIGSEMSGGVSNVFVYDCQMTSRDYSINFKANKDRGGKVHNVFIKNIEIDSVKKAMFNFTTNYHSWRGNNFPPQFRDIYLENLNCKLVEDTAFKLEGTLNYPIFNIFVKNVNVLKAAEPISQQFTKNVIFENTKVNNVLIK